VLILLCGGDKDSQARDIERAKIMARETGISREALYRAFSDNGNPTLDTLLCVMKAFGSRSRRKRQGDDKLPGGDVRPARR
jgi:hypothetical protein